MGIRRAFPALLSGASAGRRLDITHRRLVELVESGGLTPIGLLNGSPIFDAESIAKITGDLVLLNQVRGVAGRP